MRMHSGFQRALFDRFVEQEKLRTYQYGGSRHLELLNNAVTFEQLDRLPSYATGKKHRFWSTVKLSLNSIVVLLRICQ
jgi:hypothetical protein